MTRARMGGVTAEPLGEPPRRKRTQSTRGRRSAIVNGQPIGGTEWAALRQRWQTRLPQPCPRCPDPVQPWEPWDLDHVGDPVALGGRTGVDQIRPAHRACNRAAGKDLGDAIRRAGIAALKGDPQFFDDGHDARGSRPASPSSERTDPVTPGPEDSYWDAAPWLAELRAVPDNATWPRLMSGIHPDAVNSHGAEAIAWIRETFGLELRWWQQLAITRILEYDADGDLVWLRVLVSTARQVGKSYLLSALALWRMCSADTFGQVQSILHAGKELGVCRQVQAPARIWGRAHGFRVIETNGKESMTGPDGSVWVIRSQRSVYGFTATFALLDEAWAVDASHVEEGIEPTMAERPSAQMALFSTAHRRATALVPLRRASAFATWDNPTSLILEWSAPGDADINDRGAWRLASPHWSRSRERLLESKIADIELGVSQDPDEDDAAEAFRSQFLNVWPMRALMPRGNAEPLVPRDMWLQRRDDYAAAPPDIGLTVAIEDWYGMGAAGAACAALPDGRLLVWGALFHSRAEAYAWAGFTIGKRAGCRLLIGATIGEADPAANVPEADGVYLVGSAQSRAALPLVRSLIRSGRLSHSGDEDMTTQVTTVRLIATPSGGLVFAHGDAVRPDLLKALAWAVADQAEPLTAAPEWFVY